MKQIRIVTRILALLFVFVSLALSLGILRPLLRSWRKRQTSDLLVKHHLKLMRIIMGVEIHSEGDSFPLRPFLLLSNHLSYLDIIVLGSLAPMSFMAKEEVGAWPVIGFLARKGRAVFVQRESVRGRVQSLHQAKRLLREESLCIFPEGTTTAKRSPDPRQWYRGNICLGRESPVFCVGIHYEDQEEIAWIDDQELVPHLIHTLGKRPIKVYLSTKAFPLHSSSIAFKEMSQLAHKEVCRLTDASFAAANRSHLTVEEFSPASRRTVKSLKSLR